MKKLLQVLSILVVISSVFYVADANAKKWTMKIAHTNPGDPYVNEHHALATVFKSILEAKSGGAVKVEIYPAAQLGGNRELMEAMQMGSIQGYIASSAWLAPFTPLLQTFRIPFLFSSELVAYTVIDGAFGDDIFEEVRKTTGIRILACADDSGFTHFTNNVRPIRVPADMKGLKMRTMSSPIIMKMVEALGAAATVIPWPELYTSLQTGVVDGQDNGISAIMFGKLFEVQKYLILTGHFYSLNPFYVNDKWFSSLPSDLQKVAQAAAKTGVIAARGLTRIRDATGIEFLKEKGMDIYTPTPQELAQFRKTCQSVVIEELNKVVGKDWVERLIQVTKESENKY
ncbi:MAG: DctP family TRAP transporter solute-binding subunit [Planctomycetota bacterium]